MKIIAWLWNPWDKYKSTRHNAWFLFLDYFQKNNDFPEFKEEKKFFWTISTGDIQWEKIILLKPLTYMNNSWNAVLAIKKFYKINEDQIIVIYDDKDIPFNNIRYRENWSSWWHNWIKDISNALNTSEIARIKIWVAYENSPIQNTADFVLSKFNNNEILELKNIFEKTKVMLLKWLNK